MLRKTLVKRIVSLVTAVVLVCSCISSASAVTNTATQNVADGSYTLMYKVTSTTSTAKITPFTQTQTLHTKGIITTIGIVSSIRATCKSSSAISAVVGASYAGVSASLALSLGDSQAVVYTLASTVQYTIPATVASGRYRIEVVFPQDKATFTIVRKASNGGLTPVASGTITTMPRTSDSYRRLTRYANP